LMRFVTPIWVYLNVAPLNPLVCQCLSLVSPNTNGHVFFVSPIFTQAQKKFPSTTSPVTRKSPPVWGAEVSAAVAQIDMQIEIQLKQRQPHLGTSSPVPWNRPWSNGGSDLVALTWSFYIY
jgi:hypothetical protein